MTAVLNEIEGWINEGVNKGATHLIVACDTFDYDNYPVYVMPGTNVVEEVTRIRGSSMQRVDEVYDLARAIKLQLEEHRAFHPEITRVAGIAR